MVTIGLPLTSPCAAAVLGRASGQPAAHLLHGWRKALFPEVYSGGGAVTAMYRVFTVPRFSAM